MQLGDRAAKVKPGQRAVEGGIPEELAVKAMEEYLDESL